MFSYISAERRVPKDHPLRAIRVMTEAALGELEAQFDALYASSGRPSIPPEKLLRALLLQVLYTVRSERLLMEHLDADSATCTGSVTSQATASAFPPSPRSCGPAL